MEFAPFGSFGPTRLWGSQPRQRAGLGDGNYAHAVPPGSPFHSAFGGSFFAAGVGSLASTYGLPSTGCRGRPPVPSTVWSVLSTPFLWERPCFPSAEIGCAYFP